MTIEPRVQTAISAKASGFRYVRSETVAVVSVCAQRDSPRTPLALVLRSCVSVLADMLSRWLRSMPNDRVLLFVATPSSGQHNAVKRYRGVWTNDLQWLGEGTKRSPSIEFGGGDALRFAGIAQIDEEHLPDAAEFVRTHSTSFLLVSPRVEFDEERVRSIAAKALPGRESTPDWAAVVDQVEAGDDICIRVTGNFDDREVSIDAFLSVDLLRRIGS